MCGQGNSAGLQVGELENSADWLMGWLKNSMDLQTGGRWMGWRLWRACRCVDLENSVDLLSSGLEYSIG